MNAAAAPWRPGSTAQPADVRQIEQEIEATRAELDRTLAALQARLSPRRRVQAALRTARERGGELAQQTLQLARQQPIAFVVAGMSLVSLLAFFAARAPGRRD